MTAFSPDLSRLDPALAEPVLRDPWLPPEAPLAMPSQPLERAPGWLAAALLAPFARPGHARQG